MYQWNIIFNENTIKAYGNKIKKYSLQAFESDPTAITENFYRFKKSQPKESKINHKHPTTLSFPNTFHKKINLSKRKNKEYYF